MSHNSKNRECARQMFAEWIYEQNREEKVLQKEALQKCHRNSQEGLVTVIWSYQSGGQCDQRRGGRVANPKAWPWRIGWI